MKILSFTLAAIALVSSAGAADLSLKDGRVLRNTETISVRPGYASILHADGTSEVARELLPRNEAREVPALLDAAELSQVTEAWQALSVGRFVQIDQRQIGFTMAFDPAGDLSLSFVTQWTTESGRDDDSKPLSAFHFSNARRDEVLDALSLFAEWTSENRAQNVPSNRRPLATIDGWDLLYNYTASAGATLKARGSVFAADEVAAFAKLMSEFPSMQAEFQEKMEAVRAPFAALAELRPRPTGGGRGRSGVLTGD